MYALEDSLGVLVIKQKQCNPFITHCVITQIWIKLGHAVALIVLSRLLQMNYRKMTIKWSFSYNFFVKLSFYNMIHL